MKSSIPVIFACICGASVLLMQAKAPANGSNNPSSSRIMAQWTSSGGSRASQAASRVKVLNSQGSNMRGANFTLKQGPGSSKFIRLND